MQSMAVCSDIGNYSGYFPNSYTTTGTHLGEFTVGGDFTVDMPGVSWPNPVECYPSIEPLEPLKPLKPIDIRLVIPQPPRDPKKDPKTGKFYRKIEVEE